MFPPQLRSTLFPYTTLFRSTGGSVPSSRLVGIDFRAWHRSKQRFSRDRKSTRLNSSHLGISYAVFCLKKKKKVVWPFILRFGLKELSVPPKQYESSIISSA